MNQHRRVLQGTAKRSKRRTTTAGQFLFLVPFEPCFTLKIKALEEQQRASLRISLASNIADNKARKS